MYNGSCNLIHSLTEGTNSIRSYLPESPEYYEDFYILTLHSMKNKILIPAAVITALTLAVAGTFAATTANTAS